MTTTYLRYFQCTLRRGDSYQVAWLEGRFAVVGKLLNLTPRGQTDSLGWRVVEVCPQAVSHSFVMAHRDDYRYQRRVSDV